MFLLLTTSALAADVGTFPVSTWYETIFDADGNTIWFQIHYPATQEEFGSNADPTGGPFPVIGLMHGYLGQAWMYQSASDTFASMGFVVVNMDTETGAWMDPYALADYTQTAIEWVEARSAEQDHWLAGMADGGDWAVMGHSMGGIAMASLADQSPRVDLVVGFAPYRDDDYRWDAYVDFEGAALLIGGNEDETSTPKIVSGWLADIDAPTRGLYAEVAGAGHQAVTDIELEPATLTDAEQLDANLALAEAFLRAERFGDEQAYDALVCAPLTPLSALEARGTSPATAAVAASDSEVQVSLVGAAGDEVVIFGGSAPADGSSTLSNAVELTRVTLVEGAACADVALPPELAGVAWVQAVHTGAAGERTARPIDVFGVGSGPPDTGGPAGDDDDTGMTGGAGCGCRTGTPGHLPMALLSALVPLLARRRA